MAGYSKHTSSYIYRKFHQNTNGGTIFERDWTSIGERNAIEPGKIRVYNDSGFIFTENRYGNVKRRSKIQEWSGPYTENDLSESVNGDVNALKLPDSNDIRDYAYYGSASELVRSSIENIVKWFPGKAWTDGAYISRIIDGISNYTLFSIENNGNEYILTFNEDSTINKDPDKGEINVPSIFKVENPFEFDFFKSGIEPSKYINEMRNIPYSWRRYYIKGSRIISYTPWIKPYDECEPDYNVVMDVYVKYETFPSVSTNSILYSDYGYDDSCIRLTDTDNAGENDCVAFSSTEKEYFEGHIYGLKIGNGIVLCTDIPGFTIVPQPSVIESYFNNLDGLEKVLLTRKTAPLYEANIITPINVGNDTYMVPRKYRFPSKGYCIICDGMAFNEYANNLYGICEILDDKYCDNIWCNMTHETVRNFDWTYQREYEDGDELENIFGGTRMQEILRIYGRFFDDVKRYVDGISLGNRITVDGTGGFIESLLSDKAYLRGWDVYSTKIDNTENMSITDEYIQNTVSKKSSRWGVQSDDDSISIPCDSQPVWFTGLNADAVTQNDVDNYFMRMLVTQSGSIFSRKGTRQSIEMVYSLFGIGNNEYDIIERYYSVVPIKSDSEVYVYVLNENPDYPEDYKDVTDYNSGKRTTLKSYIDDYNGGTVDEDSEPYISINDIYYDLKKMTFKEMCEYINERKSLDKNYESDKLSGIPLNEVTIGAEKYMVPYFSQDYMYDGNVQFQSDGGWCKTGIYDFIDDDEIHVKDNYVETKPYVVSVPDIRSLTLLNVNDLNVETLYYVCDINDIVKYNVAGDIAHMSNYFKITDKGHTYDLSGWSNVPIPDEEISSEYEYDEFCNELDIQGNPVNQLYYGVTYDDYELMLYYESIVPDNKGNNPHTGNGIYDLGNRYLEYVKAPFRYSEMNNGFNDESLEIMAEKVRFDVETIEGDKIILNDNPSEKYYLPGKQLIIIHKNTGLTFANYFEKVIMKYVTQVIPSTAILFFELK